MTTTSYRLLLVGAGGFGREVYSWITRDPESVKLNAPWDFGGFLSSNHNDLSDYEVDYPILSDPATYTPSITDRFVCAIGDPIVKLKVCRDLQTRGAEFVSVISSQAIVGTRCHLGVGCVLVPTAVLTTDVRLGSFVTLNVFATAGHDVIMGDGCTLSAHCDVTGRVRLGVGVFLGSHATVAPSVEVADYARIGAGSAVVRNVPPYTTVMGVPAKVIFSRPDDLKSEPT